jgi:very-short-patch-repair endonuclease
MQVVLNRQTTKDLRRYLRRNQTDAEKVLWSRLRNRGLGGYKFYRQYGVGGL